MTGELLLQWVFHDAPVAIRKLGSRKHRDFGFCLSSDSRCRFLSQCRPCRGIEESLSKAVVRLE